MTVNVKNNSTSTRTHEHHKTQQTRQDLKTPERITNIEMVPPCFAEEVTVIYSAGDFHSHLFEWMGLGNSVVPGSDCRMVWMVSIDQGTIQTADSMGRLGCQWEVSLTLGIYRWYIYIYIYMCIYIYIYTHKHPYLTSFNFSHKPYLASPSPQVLDDYCCMRTLAHFPKLQSAAWHGRMGCTRRFNHVHKSAILPISKL